MPVTNIDITVAVPELEFNRTQYIYGSNQIGGWHFKSSNIFDFYYAQNLVALSRSLAIIRDFSVKDTPRCGYINDLSVKSAPRGILTEILNCFAPDAVKVDSIANTILQGKSLDATQLASDHAATEKTIVKDKSWVLDNKYIIQDVYNNNSWYITGFKDKDLYKLDNGVKFELTPFLLAFLTKQNDLAFDILNNHTIDLKQIHLAGFNFFELAWLINSRMIHENEELAAKYNVEICSAFFSLNNRFPKLRLNTQLLIKHLKNLQHEQLAALFSAVDFEKLYQRAEFWDILSTFWDSGIKVNRCLNPETRDTALHYAIRHNDYVGCKLALARTDIDVLKPNRAELCAIELITGKFLDTNPAAANEILAQILAKLPANTSFKLLTNEPDFLHGRIHDRDKLYLLNLCKLSPQLLSQKHETRGFALIYLQAGHYLYELQQEIIELAKVIAPLAFAAYQATLKADKFLDPFNGNAQACADYIKAQNLHEYYQKHAKEICMQKLSGLLEWTTEEPSVRSGTFGYSATPGSIYTRSSSRKPVIG